MNKTSCFYNFTKRSLDLFLSITAVFLLSPIMLFASVLVYFKMGREILFCQERVGLNNKIFKIYKFKTMVDTRDEHGQLLAGELRLTKLGKLLRSLSFDELPQLFNVIKGDLSLVGPRPLLVDYLSLYSPEQRRRHEVKPGITGWAQINGRNAISWEEKFRLDIWYVDHRSLLLDMKILLCTVIQVIMRHGVNQSDEITMERFKG